MKTLESFPFNVVKLCRTNKLVKQFSLENIMWTKVIGNYVNSVLYRIVS